MDLKSGGVDQLAKHLNVSNQDTRGSATEDISDFDPHILHSPHSLFPIVMACRPAHDRPGHSDTTCPQDAAFLWSSMLPFQACRRGIEIILYLNLGFNDLG